MTVEEFMGYGVLFDDKPAGIWPIGLKAARTYVDRKLKDTPSFGRDRFSIVPLHAGIPVPQVEPAPLNLGLPGKTLALAAPQPDA